jgi:hypothetical protein
VLGRVQVGQERRGLPALGVQLPLHRHQGLSVARAVQPGRALPGRKRGAVGGRPHQQLRLERRAPGKDAELEQPLPHLFELGLHPDREGLGQLGQMPRQLAGLVAPGRPALKLLEGVGHVLRHVHQG